MYAKQSYRIEDRIVSIHQPHVRPIIRGKAKASVEFGAKVAISLVNGYALIEKVARNAIEGNSEKASRRYGLGLIRARLQQTNERTSHNEPAKKVTSSLFHFSQMVIFLFLVRISIR